MPRRLPPGRLPGVRAVIHLAAAAALFLAAAPQAPQAHAPADTKCSACHTPEDWGDVNFVHERTGFPLTGQHAQVACRSATWRTSSSRCPAAARPATATSTAARGHPVRHLPRHRAAGSRRFDADAHRRTNFPLQGRHALSSPASSATATGAIAPSRAPPSPAGSATRPTSPPRRRRESTTRAFPGYPQLACLGCHGFWRWSPATFSGHGACFPIDSGNHAGIPCMQCHVTLPVPLVIGSCTSQPYPSCIRCHPCATHPQVQSFVCADQTCYGCHYNGTGQRGWRETSGAGRCGSVRRRGG